MAQNWGALLTPAHASDTHFDSPNISYVSRVMRGISPPARLRFSPPKVQPLRLRFPDIGLTGNRRPATALRTAGDGFRNLTSKRMPHAPRRLLIPISGDLRALNAVTHPAPCPHSQPLLMPALTSTAASHRCIQAKLTATTGLFAMVMVEVSLLVIDLSLLAATSAMIRMRRLRPDPVVRSRGDTN